MGVLRYSINITVDGCCDHRAGPVGPALHAHHAAGIRGAAALLFGRITYRMMEEAFRPGPGEAADASDPFAVALDAARKYVVSDSLGADPADEAGWNTEIVRGDDLAGSVRRIVAEAPGDVQVGGVSLPRALAALGLIDVYEFVVLPRIAGTGPQVLSGLAEHVDLRLVDREEIGDDIIVLRYEPVRA